MGLGNELGDLENIITPSPRHKKKKQEFPVEDEYDVNRTNSLAALEDPSAADDKRRNSLAAMDDMMMDNGPTGESLNELENFDNVGFTKPEPLGDFVVDNEL